jgi:hypothetical protein
MFRQLNEGNSSQMHRSKCNRLELAKKAFICILAKLLIFFGFSPNRWQVADQKWFIYFQRDSESLIVGRLVKSRQEGTFSAGGLTGFGSPYTFPVKWNNQPFEYQYRASQESRDSGKNKFYTCWKFMIS